MVKSGVALAALLICAGIAIFFVIYWVGPWMHPQMSYGSSYWIGPTYGYGPDYGINATVDYRSGYSMMSPWMMYRYEPERINATGLQTFYGQGYSISIADELNKLAVLRKEGMITSDEYNQLKNQLINKSLRSR